MRQYATYVLSLFLILCASKSSWSAEEAFTVGIGIVPCAQYAKAYQESPDYTEKLITSWTLGYLTAFNQLGYGSINKVKNLSSLTSDDFISHVNRYCADHPLNSWSEGAMSLFGKLPELSDETKEQLDKFNGK